MAVRRLNPATRRTELTYETQWTDYRSPYVLESYYTPDNENMQVQPHTHTHTYTHMHTCTDRAQAIHEDTRCTQNTHTHTHTHVPCFRYGVLSANKHYARLRT